LLFNSGGEKASTDGSVFFAHNELPLRPTEAVPKLLMAKQGIQHNLRRIVSERAQSAREAVKIAGALVERYGYIKSRED